MVTLLIVMAGLLLLGSLPHWLPSKILALRMRLFTRINGDEAIAIPGALVDISRFKEVYSHPAANGRSRGAALSDLFWYWLSPGPQVHQEHIESGEQYEEVARCTRRLLAIPKKAAEDLAADCVERMLSRQNIQTLRLVRLRDLMMPVWAEFYYELVFGEPCTSSARDLIVGNANDVVTSLKCCGLRHMRKRLRLTQFLIAKIKTGKAPKGLPVCLTTLERAFYLQGTFFNTAIVQMSEAMVHLFMALAHHTEVQARLVSDPSDEQYLGRVINETLRLYPLFGISHRITSADIPLDGGTTLPKGSILCFNHPAFHRAGFDNAEHFDPDRWENLAERSVNYIPFGVASNRSCPAQRLALVTIQAATRAMLERFTLYSTASHTRSIPHRGPCLLAPRHGPSRPRLRATLLAYMRMRDRWEDVWRSILQLVFGTFMVLDARRRRLCARHFEGKGRDEGAQGTD